MGEFFKAMWQATLEAFPALLRAMRGKQFSVSTMEGEPVRKKARDHVKKRLAK